MPLALALAASLLLHMGALFGLDLEFPGLSREEPPPVVVASLPPVSKAPASAAKPLPPRPARPPRPAATAASDVAAPAPAAAPAAAAAANGAASPAPSFEPPAPALPAVPTAPLAPAVAAAPPSLPLAVKGRVRYALIRGEAGLVVGAVTQEWEQAEGSYRFNSVTETTGLAALFKPARVVQDSQGRITAGGLQPEDFRHRKLNGEDRAQFDWQRQVLAYEGREVALPEGTQDMLSLYYQAAWRAQPEMVLELPIATGRKLDRYRFEPRGEEKLEIAGKAWRTWRYAAKSGADLLELWIAEEWRGLPLKIRFVDRKGEIYDQIVEAVPEHEN